MADTKYQKDEVLLWQQPEGTAIEGQTRTWVHRQCTFEAYDPGKTTATVRWGFSPEGQPRRYSGDGVLGNNAKLRGH